jgi:hypothetical protein
MQNPACNANVEGQDILLHAGLPFTIRNITRADDAYFPKAFFRLLHTSLTPNVLLLPRKVIYCYGANGITEITE